MEKPDSDGRRVAFFGGSFDPPHLGHLTIARAACDALRLDEVLFAPVGAQPLKPGGSTASFEDRVAMTRLAVAGEPAFAVSLVDAPKSGLEPNYTLDALLRLRAELPTDGQLFCLMGADSLHTFRHWHRAAEIPFIGTLIVVSRPGEPLDNVVSALPSDLSLSSQANAAEHGPGEGQLYSRWLSNAAGESAALYVLSGINVDISATHVREWLRSTGPSTDLSAAQPLLLPVAVFNYIKSRGLYS